MKISTALVVLFSLAGFSAFAQDSGKTLQQQLDERAAQSKTPPEVKAKMKQHLDELKQSKIEEQSLKTGDKAPDFTLKNQQGKEVTLSEFLAKGPVILTWYRGGW